MIDQPLDVEPQAFDRARHVGRNIALQFTDRGLRLAIGFLVNVWIVRYLGPQGLGLLGFAQSLVALTAVAAEVGLESILVRELVRRPGDSTRLLATAGLMRLTGSAVAIVLAVLSSLLLRPGDSGVLGLVLVLASATSFQALEVLASWFQSRSRFAPFLVARGAAFLVSAAAKVWCLATDAGIGWLAAAIALESWLAAVALVLAYRLGGGARGGFRPSRDEARHLWRSAWPLILNSAALVTAARLDQVLLTQLRGPSENGLYAAAQRLCEMLYFVPTAVTVASAPGLIRAHALDVTRYRAELGRLLRRLLWVAVGLAAPISLLAGPIVHRLFGPEFSISGQVLAVIVWAAPAVFLGVGQSNWFIVEGRTAGLLLRSAVAAIGIALLDLLLIPGYGAVGAAIAVVVAQTLAFVGVNAAQPATRPLLRLQLEALLPWRRP